MNVNGNKTHLWNIPLKKYLPTLLSWNELILVIFYFRMAFNKSLNAACDLNGYLFCKMPKGALEVEVKVKTTYIKFTMIQDTHTRTEKYHTWEKAQRCHVRSRKGRTPHKTTNVQTEDNASETDVPTGQGCRYPPQNSLTPHMQWQWPTQSQKER